MPVSVRCVQSSKHSAARSTALADTPLPATFVSLDQVSREVPVIYVVDDNEGVRALIMEILEDDGYSVELFASCEAYLSAHDPDRQGCILADVIMRGMGAIEMLEHLRGLDQYIPVVVMSGYSDVPMAVAAMKAGAFDFIQKPFHCADLLSTIGAASKHAHLDDVHSRSHFSAARRMAGLTARQRQVLDLVIAGHPSKNIAADLGISQRTVDNHRAAISRRTGSSSLPELIRTALAAKYVMSASAHPLTPYAPHAGDAAQQTPIIRSDRVSKQSTVKRFARPLNMEA